MVFVHTLYDVCYHILLRYDIRDSIMDRDNQENKCRKILAILVLLLCAGQLLHATIVLETPQTEVKVVVTDRMGERSELPFFARILPLCSILISAKHKGSGLLKITHSPLHNEFERVNYTLLCDVMEGALPDTLSYTCDSAIPLIIPLTRISIELDKPLQGDRSSYTSEVYLHLRLDL